MIRPFEPSDVRRLKPNDFCKDRDMSDVFNDPEFYKFSLVDDSDVLCIMAFKKYWGDCWMTCSLMSEDIKPVHAKQLKKFLHTVINDFGMQRMQTYDLDCAFLNRWHLWLGFTLEGVCKKMIFNKDYCTWAVVK